MKAGAYPTAEEIARFFRYESGNLYWIARPKRSCIVIGQRAGLLDRVGYYCVQLNGRKLYGHRLIWILQHGPIPDDMEIDHINRVKSDNRIENLRLVTKSGNGQNREALRIYWHNHGQKCWMFHRMIAGKRITRNFKTKEEAMEYARNFSQLNSS